MFRKRDVQNIKMFQICNVQEMECFRNVIFKINEMFKKHDVPNNQNMKCFRNVTFIT